MALPKIKTGDVVTVFGRECVVQGLEEGASDYDLWTSNGWYHSRDVVKVVRRTVIGWRHYRPVPAMGDKCMLHMKAAFEWKRGQGGRVVRVIRKRTWYKGGTK